MISRIAPNCSAGKGRGGAFQPRPGQIPPKCGSASPKIPRRAHLTPRGSPSRYTQSLEIDRCRLVRGELLSNIGKDPHRLFTVSPPVGIDTQCKYLAQFQYPWIEVLALFADQLVFNLGTPYLLYAIFPRAAGFLGPQSSPGLSSSLVVRHQAVRPALIAALSYMMRNRGGYHTCDPGHAPRAFFMSSEVKKLVWCPRVIPNYQDPPPRILLSSYVCLSNITFEED